MSELLVEINGEIEDATVDRELGRRVSKSKQEGGKCKEGLPKESEEDGMPSGEINS